MANSASPPTPSDAARRDSRPRRGVNTLLSAYYSIDGGAADAPPRGAAASSGVHADLDRQNFDAKRYFDGVVQAGQLPDLVKRSADLDTEVKGLDGEMQRLVYDNYTHFTRAATVISRMKVCIESLGPDIDCLERGLGRMTTFEDQAESRTSGNSQELALALRRRKACRKLDVLFGLPSLLEACLERGVFAPAVEAHICCAGFLARHRHMPSLEQVHREVERLIAKVHAALEERLRSPDVPVLDASGAGRLLLRLGAEPPAVLRWFLEGRTAVLERHLSSHFASIAAEVGDEAAAATEASPGAWLEAASSAAAAGYVPALCDAAAAAAALLGAAAGDAPGAAPGAFAGSATLGAEALADFARARVEALFGRVAAGVQRRCPAAQVLAACAGRLCEGLEPLQPRAPGALPDLLARRLCDLAGGAARAVFAAAAAATIADLRRLREECARPAGEEGPADILEATAAAERALILHGYNAVAECRHLLGLLRADAAAAQQLVRHLNAQLAGFFLAFVDLCHALLGQDPDETRAAFPTLLAMGRSPAADFEGITDLGWNGLFSLILVRMGRHLEVKVISKVWSAARDMFAASAVAPELAPHPDLIRATRGAAQALITHYTVMNGQRLAHGFRTSIERGDWPASGEPRDPRLLGDVVRDMRTWDSELAVVLGDPRKERGSERRSLSRHVKGAMELEMERLWAKRLQTFSPSPFNRNGVVVGILRIGFKALYELVRDATFSKRGLQQIQVDCAFLSAFVQDFAEVDDASMLVALLNEAVNSATQRCEEPMLMDAAILETLCEENKRQFKLD